MAATEAAPGSMDPGGTDESAPAAPAVEVAEPSIFQQYLRKILPIMLEDGAITPSPVMEKAIESSANQYYYKKFLSDNSTKVLLVRKSTLRGKLFYLRSSQQVRAWYYTLCSVKIYCHILNIYHLKKIVIYLVIKTVSW